MLITQKRITWLLLSVLASSISLIVATRYSRGETAFQPSQPIRMKVLRKKDEVGLKPTKEEIAHSQEENETNERKLENTIPKHVPIKIKIRKEKEAAFKDMKNERWARDFELEVTNTGESPIYEFYLVLITDIRAAAGYRIIAPVYYGRAELSDLKTRPEATDVPLRPGETTILKIHPSQLEAWEILQKKENRPYPKKIRILFQDLSFGDGTGYFGADGVKLPRTLNERSSLAVMKRTEVNTRRRLHDFNSIDCIRLFKLSTTESARSH